MKCFQQPVCVDGIPLASIGPKTLALKELVHNEEGIKDKFGTPTTALQIGNHLWMGTVRGDRLAIPPLEP